VVLDSPVTEATRDSEHNGLQALAARGVPDSAITALLVAVATLTVLPHIAGREFGPYSFPDVLTPGIFWILSLTTPVIWVVLFSRVAYRGRTHLKRFLAIATVLMSFSGLMAFASSTTTHSRDEEFRIEAGKEHAFLVDLPAVSRATQRLDVTLLAVRGVDMEPRVKGVGIGICGAEAATTECKFQQTGVNTTLVRRLEKGSVRIAVFNYNQNQTAVEVRLRVAHLRRRFM
jgi:hypothetical protein